jgi:hypothetical protein
MKSFDSKTSGPPTARGPPWVSGLPDDGEDWSAETGAWSLRVDAQPAAAINDVATMTIV